ncbi:hypothetical protein QAD02_005187 [Eretmocerus hayati]|uniref:Uncharacterized protein n=1 Tax=Eretmocerus hayati TaxID=131215 RepID=A0ACC2NRU2_9HYME|nr:hypothetical protein QAD02_005187 [Eretmocerus hayati]
MIQIVLMIGLARIIHGGDISQESHYTPISEYDSSNGVNSFLEPTTDASLEDSATTPINYGDAEVSRVTRIRNGVFVLDKNYPWIVNIHFSPYHMPGYCGGSIIAPKFVLTATHCLYKGSQPLADADHINVVSSYGQKGFAYYFAKVIPFTSTLDPVHFVPYYDITVIVLREPIQNARTISLPPRGFEVPPGTLIQAFGWGENEYAKMSRTLRTALVKTIPCYNNWYNRMMPYICIDSSISSTCPGDSGGPVVYKGYLVGIVSRGARPCGTGPVTFTKVSQYIDWIQSVMSKNF